MNRKLLASLVILVLAVACRQGSSRRNQQPEYETVQEGAASGVTSTIQGPGETLPAITDTNADTTNAFALDSNALPPSQISSAAPPPPTTAPIATTAIHATHTSEPPPEPTETAVTTTTSEAEEPVPADETTATTATTSTEEPPPPPPPPHELRPSP